MPGCLTEETVLTFVEGRLRPGQRELIESHLSGCEACGELLAVVVEIGHDVRGLVRVVAPKPADRGGGAFRDPQFRVADLEAIVI